jgi:hypothetical protein
MNDVVSKVLLPTAPPAPESDGFGKPGGPIRPPLRRPAPTDQPERQSSVKRSRRYRPAIQADLLKDPLLMAKEHRKKHRALFLSDPQLKDRAARFCRSLLPPKPKRRGRSPLTSVTVAFRLLARLKREYPYDKLQQIWKRIYPPVIPNYATLTPDQQKAERLLSRDRVRSRRNQRHRQLMKQGALR